MKNEYLETKFRLLYKTLISAETPKDHAAELMFYEGLELGIQLSKDSVKGEELLDTLEKHRLAFINRDTY